MSRAGVANDGDMLPMFWNLMTGAPLDGKVRTDASWVRRGQVAYVDDDPRHDAWLPRTRWHFLPRLERALIRWALLAVVAVLVWPEVIPPITGLCWAHPEAVTEWSIRSAWLAAFVSFTVGGWRAAGAALMARQRREWMWPLHLVLHEAVGTPRNLHPRWYIRLPRKFPLGQESIWIILPADFSGAVPYIDEEDVTGRSGSPATRGAMLKQLLSEKLPLSQKQFVFHLKGRNHFLEIRPVPQAPEKAPITNPAVRKLVEAQPENQPPIGLKALPLNGNVSQASKDAGGLLEHVDFSAETPHLGIMAAPGAGKSVVAAAIAAHVLRHGGYVIVLDRRRNSHKWAKGLEGVTYVKTVQDIHNALVLIGAEANARMDYLEDWDDDKGPPMIPSLKGQDIPLPRYLVVTEEVNATIEILTDFWKEHRDKDDAKMSPAIAGYRDVHFMGRQPKFNSLIIGQSGDAQGMGGRNIRETLQGGLMVAKYSRQQWMMLAGHIPMPKKSDKTGRWQLVRAGKAQEIQGLWFDEPSSQTEESLLIQYARAGLDRHGVPVVESRPPSPIQAALVAVSGTMLRSAEDAARLIGSQVPTASTLQGDEAVNLTAPRLELVPAPTPDEGQEDTEDAELVTPTRRLVGLREAIEGDPDRGRPPILEGITLDSLRERRANDPDFPAESGKQGQELMYLANELIWWHTNRDRKSPSKDGQTA